MNHTRPNLKSSVPSAAALPLLCLWLVGVGSVQAQSIMPERVVWQKEPIPLVLSVGRERRVDFPGSVKVGVPPQLEAAVEPAFVLSRISIFSHSAISSVTLVMVPSRSRKTGAWRDRLPRKSRTAEDSS